MMTRRNPISGWPLAWAVMLACGGVEPYWANAAEPEAMALWPADAPGESGEIGPEQDTTKESDNLIAGGRLIRLGNVSHPTMAIYPAPAQNNTGAAVLVFPGGGYHILALDLEGSEVCTWLNSIGVSGVLVKYRVPARKERPRHAAPLQDAQRAVGVVRSRAAELGIDPDRIGVLGFSAGGHLAAALATNHAARTYPAVDDADNVSCRPDFSLLIYPGGLANKQSPGILASEVAVTDRTPPTFLVMAQDDGVGPENVMLYGQALLAAKIAFELHLYPAGGHGYGLRRTDQPVTHWPDRAADWLKAGGFLTRK